MQGQRFTSPTRDAGNPYIDEGLLNPRNLLANPGFEAGLAGWTVNPGAGTQSTKPDPFDGTQYFAAGTSAVEVGAM